MHNCFPVSDLFCILARGRMSGLAQAFAFGFPHALTSSGIPILNLLPPSRPSSFCCDSSSSSSVYADALAYSKHLNTLVANGCHNMFGAFERTMKELRNVRVGQRSNRERWWGVQRESRERDPGHRDCIVPEVERDSVCSSGESW